MGWQKYRSQVEHRNLYEQKIQKTFSEWSYKLAISHHLRSLLYISKLKNTSNCIKCHWPRTTFLVLPSIDGWNDNKTSYDCSGETSYVNINKSIRVRIASKETVAITSRGGSDQETRHTFCSVITFWSKEMKKCRKEQNKTNGIKIKDIQYIIRNVF